MSHNNSYGNYAGSYLNECLPNITGDADTKHNSYGQSMGWERYTGAFAKTGNYFVGSGHNGNGSQFSDVRGANVPYRLYFQASSSNPTYRNNCNAVRPKSYGVYIWIRSS